MTGGASVANTRPSVAHRTAFIPTEACRNSHSVAAGKSLGTSCTAGMIAPATATIAT